MPRRTSPPTLESLPNLGPQSVERLRAVGIDTVDALHRVGAVAAFSAARRASPRASLNLLWALHGAVAGVPWQEVAREHRTSLLLALETHEAGLGPPPAPPAAAPAHRPSDPASSADLRTAGAGYSATPLARKLGLAPGMRVHARRWPEGHAALLEPLPPGLRFDAGLDATADLVHVFVEWRADLEADLVQARRRLRNTVPVWVSWPKKSAKRAGDVTEDIVRAVALPLGFVDVKVCAIDAVWSGLKLVVRRELR